jgi:hypothetical protein
MNAAFLEKYESRGLPIAVAPGNNPNFDVSVIPAEQIP